MTATIVSVGKTLYRLLCFVRSNKQQRVTQYGPSHLSYPLVPFHPLSYIPPGTIPFDPAIRRSRSLTSPLARLDELIWARKIDPDGVRCLRISVGADRGKRLSDIKAGPIVAG